MQRKQIIKNVDEKNGKGQIQPFLLSFHHVSQLITHAPGWREAW